MLAFANSLSSRLIPRSEAVLRNASSSLELLEPYDTGAPGGPISTV